MTHTDEFKRQVVAAIASCGYVTTAARAYGISFGAANRWRLAAGVQLPPGRQRMSAGKAHAVDAQWGKDWLKRRERAAKMRAKGMTLKAIAAKLGYRSFASVHYALKAAALKEAVTES